MLDDYTRAQVNRAVEDALRPSGMSVHSGRASIDAGMLQRLIVMIDRSAEASLEALDQIAVLDVENARLRAENYSLRAAILNALPGVRYMDPPDGGSPSLAEQLLRMAEDAERYLWLRENTYGVAPEPTPTVPHIVHIGSSSDWRSALDDAIDAARGTKPAKGE